MLLRWLEKSRCPIGLEVGGKTVRALQLARRGEGYRVMSAGCSVLPGELPATGKEREEAVEAAIRQVLGQGEFFGKQVVSCLPAHQVQYKNLRLPRMPHEELSAAVEWEATDRLQLGADQAVVQFFNAGEVRQGDELRQEVILMAAPRTMIEDHARMLLRCGLHPTAIDAVPAALARALTPPADVGPDAPARLILDVGHSTSKVLVSRQGKVLFFKLIDLGGGKFDQAVATRLGVSAQEAGELRRRLMRQGSAGEGDQPMFGSSRRESIDRAVQEALRPLYGELATEVGLCLRYYSVTFRGRRPEHLELAGGESCEATLMKVLEEELKVTVQPGSPLHEADLAQLSLLSDDKDTHHAAWAVCAGLSMRKASTAAGPVRGAA